MGRVGTVILKEEDGMDASQSRGNRTQTGRRSILRTDSTYCVILGARLSDTV